RLDHHRGRDQSPQDRQPHASAHDQHAGRRYGRRQGALLMSHHSHKTAADLERDIEARRLSIESKDDELASRLAPGELLDDALRLTRHGPGADFVQNMGRSVVNNPIPVALLASSMAWLAIKPEGVRAADGHDRSTPQGAGRDEMGEEYPVAVIKGSYLR